MSYALQSVVEGFRPSLVQRRLWSLSQTGDPSAYHVSCALLIEGAVELGRLQQTIAHSVDAHESLRTVFSLLPNTNTPMQIIAGKGDDHLPLIDVSALRQRRIHRPFGEAVEQLRPWRFDFNRGPLVRFFLIRQSPRHHVLKVVASAICIDQEALLALVQEIATNYADYPDLAHKSPAQYADVAEWLNQMIEQQSGPGYEFWQTISSARTLDSRPPTNGGSRAFVQQGLLRPVRHASAFGLDRWSGRESGVLLGCWLLYLRRAGLARRGEISVGHNCRQYPELKTCIGPLSRYLPLSVDFDWSMTFEQAVAHVFEATKEISKWSEYLEADDGRQIFCYDYTELPGPWSGGELNWNVTSAYACTSEFRLRLSWIRQQDDLFPKWEWDSKFYCESEVERIAEGYEALLEDAWKRPDARIGSLSAVGEKERQMLLVEFNATASDKPVNITLIEGIERQVRETPELIAVKDSHLKYTYRELNQRANRLARYLQNLAIGPENVVAICLARSVNMVVAMVGAMKAGAAYAPVEPDSPQERLSFMLNDLDAAAVITTQSEASVLKDLYSGPVILIEELGGATYKDEECDWRPIGSAALDNIAYVLYTSGSTGKPKGVMISHRAICNHMAWIGQQLSLASSDRVLQKTPYSFDASVWEFYAPLLAGAELLMARPGGHQDPQYLIETMVEEQVTVAQFVPSQLRMMLEVPGLEGCRALRRVFSGGEALDARLAMQIQSRIPVQLDNLYGPTEATIDATSWRYQGGKDGVVPIGRPITNLGAYVLDEYLEPGPTGTVGEIYLFGMGLARGYLKRPRLTAERFVPNPHAEDGARMYRTGDLGRWRADGVLEYAGRSDHQVKLRGFRIELGEIETVIREHAEISDAVAVVREDSPGDQMLVAYFSLKPGSQVSQSDVVLQIKKKLPDYMVPSVVMELPSLPATSNGKIDRKALPRPEAARRATERLKPRDSLETYLMQAYEEILGRSEISVRDNFFDSGGHSLKAVALAARLSKEFSVSVAVRMIFERPTVETLAAYMREQGIGGAPSCLVPMKASGCRRPLFCIHPGGGLVQVYVDLSRAIHHDQPLYALQAKGIDLDETPFIDIPSMAALYIQEIKSVQPAGPYQLAGKSVGALIALEMAHQWAQQGESVSLLASFDGGTDGVIEDVPQERWEQDMCAWERHYLVSQSIRELRMKKEGLETLQLEELLARYVDGAKKIDRVPPDVTPNQFRRFLRVFASNFLAKKRYHRPSYPGRVVLFRSEDDKDGRDPQLGWEKIAMGGVKMITLPGSNSEFLKEPGAEHFARILDEELDKSAYK
jgi:amino acid adenylation domain-containing protein